jgi:hypothetical protein
VAICSQLLVLRVVLLAIDPLALAILLAIDLTPFLGCKRPAVRFALGFNFVMNRSLLLLQTGCLGRRERTIFYALSDSLLLVPLPLINLVLRQDAAHPTQHKRAHHHAYRYPFHFQSSFRLRLSAASGLLNEIRAHKV